MHSTSTNPLAQSLEQTWRWYGPSDPVTLADVRQAGATGVVTALHETYDGEAWASDNIAQRKREVEEAGLTWSVVESIPIHPSINRGGDEAAYFTDAFATSMERLAEQGMETNCYNFMPIVDWTRTELRYPVASGGLALRFDAIAFAAYDVFLLERPGAASDYAPDVLEQAETRAKAMDGDAVRELETTIIAGLPGSELSHDRASIRAQIELFAGVDHATMFGHYKRFLETVVPRAEACGARLCVHPDDPPRSLFGIPRVVSTQADYAALLDAVPSPANGMTFCTGSLGARPDNDLPAMVEAFADRIHFVHLRNVKRDPDGSFYESDHLDGDVDMVAVIALLLAEQKRRRDNGRADWQIPMRPDHGHLLLDDISKQTNPGYSAIGRLKGLAELRGVMTALEALGHG
ncbi:MAG: mannonate dehydratase [Devosiaceae bacterium]|nr:mannonate dehydratase [Devosiaceae bacterium MH13]